MFFTKVDANRNQANETKNQAVSAKGDGIHKVAGRTIVPHGWSCRIKKVSSQANKKRDWDHPFNQFSEIDFSVF